MHNKKEEDSSLYSFFPKSRKGQGISTNAIVLIILGVVVLVVLILGFTLGFGKIAPFLSGNNVDTVVNSCNAACATTSIYDYCTAKRELKSDEGKLKEITCHYLSDQREEFGVAKCVAISCSNIEFVSANSESELESLCEGKEGKTIQALIEDTLVSMDCPETSA